MRGSLDPGSCSRIALDCRGRKVFGPPDARLLGHLKPPSLARRRRTAARRTNRRKARPAARGARQEGSEADSCPFPRPRTPRVRVRCPKGPSIKGPHRNGQSMFPGRPGARVLRQKPWLRRQTQPRPTNVGNRTIHGCSCTWSVADVDKTHLPSGARPAERQTATHRVTSCGGLLGDDERPIRSGQKGAKPMRASKFVRAQRPAFTAR